MPLNRRHKHHSLRARYISLALLLGFIMIAGASIGYQTTLIKSNEVDKMHATVSQQSEHLKHTKMLIQTAYRSMDLFLLDPQQTEQRLVVKKSLVQSIAHIEEIESIDNSRKHDFDKHLTLLKEKIGQFEIKTELLFDIRLNPLRQYPSMGIAFQIIQPIHRLITIALNEAISEAKLEILESGTEIYTDFAELQHNWNRMALFFRLYMVNRSGGFETAGINNQAETIEDIYASLQLKITHLKELNKKDKLGFDGSIAIEVLEKNMSKWMAGFREVREIDRSGEWRLDTRFIQQNILPLTLEISEILEAVDRIVMRENQKIEKSHHQIQEQQYLLLGGIILIIIIYIITMLLSLDRMVFRPIAAVARALKAEAFGESREKLIHTRTRETQDLVDAFYELNRQVHSRQSALEHQALHDALTGLPNRTMLLERMEYQLMVSRREEQPISLFVLDLNRFKEVNDTLGHHIGDQLLVDVGRRLKSCLRELDTIARLGGDEFAILLPNTTSNQSEKVAEKLVTAIKEPFKVEENQLYIGVSIGIACYPTDGEDHNILMQHADVAMYNAKLNHLGYTHYNIDEDDHSVEHLSLIQDLRQAISNNELELYFQPKMDIFENIPVGAEALLRWNHPKLGFIAPDQMIDIAEGIGLIDELTSWVMNRAIAQCAACHNAGFQLGMSINLSVKNLLNNRLSDEITTLLDKHQLNSRFVTFEVTESSVMDNPENSVKVLNELSEIGVAISVDDFGTGFSSLTYLKQLPVNELKIDKSFVMEMEHNDSDAVIVHSTIELGHNLGLYVVAEGVEDQQTLNILKHYGCDLAQGYFIAHPLPADEFMAWLKAHKG